MKRFAAATLLVLLACSDNGASATSTRVNCDRPHEQALDLAPHNSGPLTLETIYCKGAPEFATAEGRIVSPDARSVMYLDRDNLLQVSPLNQHLGWTAHDLGVNGLMTNAAPFAWRADSGAVWGVRDERMRPRGGWRLRPLRALRIDNARTVELPEISLPAGGLDDITWIGGQGLALAEFGTHGGYYRPERTGDTPTLAIINAATGRVLDSVAMAAIPRPADARPFVRLRDRSAIVLPDGRVRVLLRMHPNWVIWDQGSAPRAIADPYPRERGAISLTPDGTRVLWLPALEASGMICEIWDQTPCPEPTAVEGVLAALHDLETGNPIWEIRDTATAMGTNNRGAISPDGRFALISMPRQADHSIDVALVAMETGEILQRVPTPPHQEFNVGFSRGGRTAWVASHNAVALYAVR